MAIFGGSRLFFLELGCDGRVSEHGAQRVRHQRCASRSDLFQHGASVRDIGAVSQKLYAEICPFTRNPNPSPLAFKV